MSEKEKEQRELDAWIAERVMGLTKEPYPDETGFKTATGGYLPRYNPTTDPAAAFVVLEKCCQAKFCGFTVAYSNGWPEPWSCGSEKADTMPLAICLFAKALFSKS